MHRTRIAILRGGPSHDFDMSLATGKRVRDTLAEELYQTFDIFIDRNGVWHRGGVPQLPHEALRHVDLVFNALHGSYGEDGKLQQQLDVLGIPYTGSGKLASSIGLHKALTKEHLKRAGIKTPYFEVVEANPNLRETAVRIFQHFPLPLVVKPINGGSSRGVSLATNFDELLAGIAHAFEHAPKVIIEEYIAGKEGTMGIIENFRETPLYATIPLEIRKTKEQAIFGMNDKLSGSYDYQCPGSFSRDEVKAIEDAVRSAHVAIGARHYSRTDFIVHPKRGVYILEVNTQPALTEHGLISKALEAIGVSFKDFLHHLIKLALA